MWKLFLGLVLLSLNINAQKLLSLEECIETALRQSPEVQIQNLSILQALEIYRYSKLNQFPSVSGNVSQGINGGRSIDPFSNSFVQRNISSNSFGIGANWNVFNGFSLKYQLEQNKNNILTEKQILELRKKELKIGVTGAFMDVLLRQELEKISAEQKKDLESQLVVLKDKVKEGILPSSQLNDFEAQLANVAFEEYSAKNNVLLAKLNLGQWLGYASKTDFELKNQKTQTANLFEFNKQHPSLKILNTKQTIAKLNLNIAKAAKYPSVSISGGLGSAYSSAASAEYNYFKQLGFNLNQYFRIGINVPIYSNGQVLSKIAGANIQEQIIKKEIEQQDLKLNQDFEKQKLEIDLLTEKLKFAEANITIQNKTYLAAKERFSEGLINSVELNTFRLNAEKAKITASQTQIELYFKKVLLETFLE
jgi:outer membrane protein